MDEYDDVFEALDDFDAPFDEFPDDPSDYQTIKTNKYNVGEFRTCVICGIANIPNSEPHYKTKCKSCFLETLNNQNEPVDVSNGRACDHCGEFKIKLTEPDWKNLCRDCYMIQRSTQEYRQCEGCGQDKVPKDAPSWKKLCYNCFSNR